MGRHQRDRAAAKGDGGARRLVEVLQLHQRIDKDILAQVVRAPVERGADAGYGAGAHRILEAIHHGAPWWSVSRSAFGREGSKATAARCGWRRSASGSPTT